MKKLWMISLIATLLVGVLFVMNRTHAATAQLTLGITAGTINNCTSATGIHLGTVTAMGSLQTLSGSTRDGDNFGCVDMQGATGWNYTMAASALVGTPAGTISNTGIRVVPSGAITVTAGSCPSITAGAGWALNSAKNIITKAAGYGQTCTFYLPKSQVTIGVDIPAWTPVGTYLSTLTIVYPS